MATIFKLPKAVPVQSSGIPYALAKMYFYETGTTTAKNVYTDAALSIAHAVPVQADAAGVFPTIYLDPTLVYKLSLKTVADVLIYTVDPVSDGALTQAQIVGILYPTTAAETSAGVTPISPYPELHAFRYMTTAQIADVTARSLTLDVRPAVQNAISVAQINGGTVYCPRGSYLIRRVAGLDAQFNGLVVPYTNVFGYAGHLKIIGDGHSTVFCAGDNSMTVVRWSDTNGVGIFAIDSNSKTGVTGISLISSNTGAAGLVEHIDHNNFWIEIRSCQEGTELECPSGGTCYYNTFHEAIWQDNTRHIRLRDHAVAKGANRNTFKVHMIGGNVGLYNDGADTTNMLGAAFEGIASGATPLATPTAVYVTATGTLGASSTSDTNLIDCQFESNTRDLDCNNRRMSILGGTCGSQAGGGIFGAIVGTATPDLWLGGDSLMRLRELVIGSATADGVTIDDRTAALTAYSNILFGGSANAAGAFPFDNDGSAIIKARSAAGSGIAFVTGSTPTLRGHIDDLGNTALGKLAALATNATDGFAYVPTCAGVPTGVPTTKTGMAAIVVDTTDNRWYFYSGGAWRNAGP